MGTQIEAQRQGVGKHELQRLRDSFIQTKFVFTSQSTKADMQIAENLYYGNISQHIKYICNRSKLKPAQDSLPT